MNTNGENLHGETGKKRALRSREPPSVPSLPDNQRITRAAALRIKNHSSTTAPSTCAANDELPQSRVPQSKSTTSRSPTTQSKKKKPDASVRTNELVSQMELRSKCSKEKKGSRDQQTQDGEEPVDSNRATSPMKLRSKTKPKLESRDHQTQDLEESVKIVQFSLPLVNDLMKCISVRTLEEAKVIAIKEKAIIDRNVTSVIMFPDSFKSLESADYEQFSDTTESIFKESLELVEGGIFRQCRFSVRRDDVHWEEARKMLLGTDNSEPKPVINELAIGEPATKLIASFFFNLELGINEITYSSPEVYRFPNTISLLKGSGLEHRACSLSQRRKNPAIYRPRFRVGSAMSVVALRESDMHHDSMHLIRHGQPRLWLAFGRDSRAKFVENFATAMRKAFNNAPLCGQILEHHIYVIVDSLIRQMDVVCVAFLQKAGDAVWVRSGTYYMVVDMGTNLTETRNFTSNTYFLECSARKLPCACPQSIAVIADIRHNANTRGTATDGTKGCCRLCDAKFKSIAKCKEHLKLYHEARYYHCEECDDDFARLSTLKRHLQSHDGEKSECPKCNKLFKDVANHMIVHKPKKTCEICHRIFTHKYFPKHQEICKANE